MVMRMEKARRHGLVVRSISASGIMVLKSEKAR